MNLFSSKSSSPWKWVPSLYLAEGLPYVIVMTVAVIMYKRLGLSNTDIAIYTSWLYLPWVIKPLWSPFVDIIKTKRWWIVAMQLLIGAGLCGIGLSIPIDNAIKVSLCVFWLISFSSATHDIAADGFYMLGLKDHEQAYFVGIRTTFYRIAMISGQGLLIIFAGWIEQSTGNIPLAWSLTFYLISAIMIGLGIWHKFSLPKPNEDSNSEVFNNLLLGFVKTFVSFFKKPKIWVAILFILLYRFAEAQLAKLTSPFMLDDIAIGGLGLSTGEVGLAYGTLGIIALVIGGIISGIFASKVGLRKALIWMLLALNIPDLLYVLLAYLQPDNLLAIYSCVIIEQLGYGFGFTGFSLYLIYISQGQYKTAHYAICTAIMALGMMLPGMFAGLIQDTIGYKAFFVWVMICTIPAFILLPFLNIDPKFGKK